MARIRMIDEKTAPPELQELYHTIAGARGGVAQVLKIHSLLPQTMRDHFQLYKTLMFGLRETQIRRPLLEMVAVIVSAANQCHYCVAHHSEPLHRLLQDEDRLRALQNRDWTYIEAHFPPQTVVLLRLAEKITLQPATVTDADIDQLKRLGYREDQILQLVLVICYFNFVNRSVLAFGLELEPDFARTCR